MVEDGCIKPSSELERGQVNDESRYDGHRGYVCCSITYPNVYLLNRFAQGGDIGDWCILLLKPDLLGESGVHFCPINAATESGRYVKDGPSGLEALFDEEIRAGNRPSKRSTRQPRSVTTDNQAEVLVPGQISLGSVFEIVVASNAVRCRAEAMLKPWHPEWRRPEVRSEDRMFRPEAYWDAKLFSDPLPLSSAEED